MLPITRTRTLTHHTSHTNMRACAHAGVLFHDLNGDGLPDFIVTSVSGLHYLARRLRAPALRNHLSVPRACIHPWHPHKQSIRERGKVGSRQFVMLNNGTQNQFSFQGHPDLEGVNSLDFPISPGFDDFENLVAAVGNRCFHFICSRYNELICAYGVVDHPRPFSRALTCSFPLSWMLMGMATLT